jgi:hypothetical protein
VIGYAEAPRYPSAIRALTGDEELVPPGLELEVDRPEWSYLKRERLWTTGPQFVAANVAGVSQVELSYANANPGVPRLICVVIGIKVCGVNVVALDRYQLTHQGALGATPAPGFARDTRLDQGAVTARSQIRTQILNTNVGVSGDILDEVSAEVTGKDLFFSIVPLMLAQGVIGIATQRYTVFSVAVNKALRVVYWGYERLARPEEVAEG